MQLKLEQIKEALGENTKKFDQRYTDSLEKLFQEYQDGECDLKIVENGVQRFVRVIKYLIFSPEDSDLILSEKKKRSDNVEIKDTLSEKCFREEDIEKAARRGLSEELDLKEGDYLLRPLICEDMERFANRFPGVYTFYELHWYQVDLHKGTKIPMSFYDKTDGEKLSFAWVQKESLVLPKVNHIS